MVVPMEILDPDGFPIAKVGQLKLRIIYPNPKNIHQFRPKYRKFFLDPNHGIIGNLNIEIIFGVTPHL